jgi:hypothetical protein
MPAALTVPNCSCAPLLRLAALLLTSLWLAMGPTQAWAVASGQDVVEASRLGTTPLSLTPYLDLLEDPGGALTLEQIRAPGLAPQFKHSNFTGEALNFGITPSAWWLRLRLANPSDQPLWTACWKWPMRAFPT